MIKYPVKIVPFDDEDFIWWTLEGADGKDICEFPEYDKDSAEAVCNALNAVNDFPTETLLKIEQKDSFELLKWYRKFIKR